MSASGTIFNIQHFSVNDGPGIRTTIFLKGCPLSCWWCHNPESRSPEIVEVNGKTIGKIYTVDEVFKIINKDRIFFEQSGGGVTFSGGEPLVQLSFLTEILKKCKENDIHTAVDTTGYTDKKSLDNIIPYTDLFLFDLKIIDPENHLKYTSASNEKILNNLKHFVSENSNVIIRIPLIPKITVTTENIKEIIKYLQTNSPEVEIDLLPYHKIANGKYDKLGIKNLMGNLPELTPEEIQEQVKKFESAGFTVNVGG